MSGNRNTSSAVKTSKHWAKLVLAWDFLVEYVGDYLSGRKFKESSVLERMNKKQK